MNIACFTGLLCSLLKFTKQTKETKWRDAKDSSEKTGIQKRSLFLYEWRNCRTTVKRQKQRESNRNNERKRRIKWKKSAAGNVFYKRPEHNLSRCHLGYSDIKVVGVDQTVETRKKFFSLKVVSISFLFEEFCERFLWNDEEKRLWRFKF